MDPADEQQYRGDKVVKRGLVSKEVSPDQEDAKDQQKGHGSPTSLSLPASSYDVRATHHATTRCEGRGLDENCTSRSHLFAFFSLLSLFALAGCFMFANSMGRKPVLHEGIVVSYNSYPKLRLPLQISRKALSKPEYASSFSDISNAQDDVGGAGEDESAHPKSAGCNEKAAMLRVYMYDLPPEFHYGMLVEPPYPEGQIWPRNASDIPVYPGGLYMQHSPEYWLTSDLLTSTMADRRCACTAFRVNDWRSADVIFVPFFASLSYNRYTKAEQNGGGDKDRELQAKLVEFVKGQPAWKASGGVDHVIVIHHPNSMRVMRDELKNAMFVVADFGRYTPEVANIGKDIVAPYKHVVHPFPEDSTSFESRQTLLFFQGAIVRKEGGVIRQKLYELIKGESDVHFEAGNTTSRAISSASTGMQNSKFCLNLAGDTPSSNRLFDAIASHCVPVIISDEIELPFEDNLDYSKFCLFVKSTDALKRDFVIDLLRGVTNDQWTQMWRRLQIVDHHFKYQHPTEPDDAVHMTWKAIFRKASQVRLLLNKEKRYAKSTRLKLKVS